MKKRKQQIAIGFLALTEIFIIEHLARTEMERALPPGLSTAGFGVLNHFVRLGVSAESPTQLARAFQVTKAAMTYTLQKLETEGLVSISADAKDGRAKVVSITKQGQRAREDALALLSPLINNLMAEINAEALERALPVLTQMRSVLDAQRN